MGLSSSAALCGAGPTIGALRLWRRMPRLKPLVGQSKKGAQAIGLLRSAVADAEPGAHGSSPANKNAMRRKRIHVRLGHLRSGGRFGEGELLARPPLGGHVVDDERLAHAVDRARLEAVPAAVRGDE